MSNESWCFRRQQSPALECLSYTRKILPVMVMRPIASDMKNGKVRLVLHRHLQRMPAAFGEIRRVQDRHRFQ
jgi:hypothetical protein